LNKSRSVIEKLNGTISRLTELNDKLSSELYNFLNMMSYPGMRQDIIAVAEALMGGKPIPSVGGGGGSSSDLRWDGRNPGEEEEYYRFRCMLAAAKFVRPKYVRAKGKSR
jgi:hypothetical protein